MLPCPAATLPPSRFGCRSPEYNFCPRRQLACRPGKTMWPIRMVRSVRSVSYGHVQQPGLLGDDGRACFRVTILVTTTSRRHSAEKMTRLMSKVCQEWSTSTTTTKVSLENINHTRRSAVAMAELGQNQSTVERTLNWTDFWCLYGRVASLGYRFSHGRRPH